jgi:hypothetical protein
MGELGQAEFLLQGREVHAEPAAVAVAESVPAADRIIQRSPPCLNSALGRWFVLIGRAEGNPAVLPAKPRVQILVAGCKPVTPKASKRPAS